MYVSEANSKVSQAKKEEPVAIFTKKLYFKCLTMFWMALCVFTKAYGYYSVQLRCCHVLPFVFTKHCEGAKLNLFILLHLYCVLWYHVVNYLMFKLFHYLLLFVFQFIFVHGLMLQRMDFISSKVLRSSGIYFPEWTILGFFGKIYMSTYFTLSSI